MDYEVDFEKVLLVDFDNAGNAKVKTLGNIKTWSELIITNIRFGIN